MCIIIFIYLSQHIYFAQDYGKTNIELSITKFTNNAGTDIDGVMCVSIAGFVFKYNICDTYFIVCVKYIMLVIIILQVYI